MPTIPELLERAESCHREVATEYFNAFSGRQERLDVVPIMERYPELYSRETYDFVNALDPAQVPDERERRFLKHIFTTQLHQRPAQGTERTPGQRRGRRAGRGATARPCPYRVLPGGNSATSPTTPGAGGWTRPTSRMLD